MYIFGTADKRRRTRIRKTVKQKNFHNPARLSAYEYDSYNKIEVDVDNLSQRFRKRKAIKKTTVLCSRQMIAGHAQ